LSYPACPGWRSGPFKVLVAAAGSFRHTGSATLLLARFGQVSTLRTIRYWSVSDQKWRPLINVAAALDGPDERLRRPDFTPSELREGKDLYFLQSETRLSTVVVERLRVLVVRPERIVVEIENVSAARLGPITLIGPGETRSIYFIQRLASDIWGYYGVGLSASDPGGLLGVGDASLVNRAVALYRHFIGVPTDRDPPAAR